MKPVDCLDVYEDAEFYDLEFSGRDFEIPFYLKHARLAQGPVLDIACGTGRLTLPIARAGIDTMGLDVSRPMLEQARRKAAAEGLKIEWIEQDCRKMNLPRKVGLAFMATNALQHLLDRESVLAFLQSARRLLQPGGTLILDVFNPDLTRLDRPPGHRHFHKNISSATGDNIRVEVETRYDSPSRVLHFDLFYLREGQLVRTKRVNLRCFFPEEMLEFCELSQFRVSRIYGSYDEAAFVASSPKQLLFLTR
jgi:SAM-dependent methyltransferase